MFSWHPDSCHILLEAAGPPPPSQRPPTNTPQLPSPLTPAALCFQWSFCVVDVFPSHSLSYSRAAAGKWPWEILPLIYCHLASENLLGIRFFCNACDFFLNFLILLFLPAFHGPLNTFLTPFILLCDKFPSFWGNKLSMQSFSSWMSSDLIFFPLTASMT